MYGNRQIHVPNLNALAAESAVFENYYVTQPLCTPSRGSLMTGLYPHNHHSYTNNIVLPESIPALPQLLNKNDYVTAYFGKWHLGDEICRSMDSITGKVLKTTTTQKKAIPATENVPDMTIS